MSSSEKPRNYVKSFFAPSFQAAMERAGREMGPDALLLDSREAPPEARHLGAYEVVFGVAQPEPNAAAEPPAADPGETTETPSAVANAPLPEFRPAPSVPSERMASLPEAEIRDCWESTAA